MQNACNFGSGVQNSDIASFGEEVCSDRESGTSIAGEVPTVQQDWTNTSPGQAIQMILLAENDICPSQKTAQTVTYFVSGSDADVTYGPDGSDDQGTVPMSITEPLGNPQYYAINAQLNGGGSVSCKIEVDGGDDRIRVSIWRLQHRRLRDRPEQRVGKLGEHQQLRMIDRGSSAAVTARDLGVDWRAVGPDSSVDRATAS